MAAIRRNARGQAEVASYGQVGLSYEAPLTIRIKAPEGSALERDVRLSVDYCSGEIGARADRVMQCLLSTPEGQTLGARDRDALRSQLTKWLADNASALWLGTALQSGSDVDTQGCLFAFQRSEAAAISAAVPAARPVPEARPAGIPEAASPAVPPDPPDTADETPTRSVVQRRQRS